MKHKQFKDEKSTKRKGEMYIHNIKHEVNLQTIKQTHVQWLESENNKLSADVGCKQADYKTLDTVCLP